jgi:hypothetical protein
MSAQDQCIVNSESDSNIEDCLKLTKHFEVVDAPPLEKLTAEVRATQAQEQLMAPLHIEYFALLALVMVLYVDILDVGGIVSRFQH